MLKEDIKDFIISRIETLPKNNEFWSEYGKAIDNEREVAEKIIGLLSKKDKKLFFDYEEYSNEVAFYEIEEAYKKGFKDSFNLFLNLIKGSD